LSLATMVFSARSRSRLVRSSTIAECGLKQLRFRVPPDVRLRNLSPGIAQLEWLMSLHRDPSSGSSPTRIQVVQFQACSQSEGVFASRSRQFCCESPQRCSHHSAEGNALIPTGLAIFLVRYVNSSVLKCCYVHHMWGVGLNVQQIVI